MRHVTVAICVPSVIVFNGLCDILRQIREFTITFRQIEPALIFEDPEVLDGLDLMIFDPLVLTTSQILAIKQNLYTSTLPFIAFYHSALPAEFIKSCDASLSVYDSEMTINSTILAALNYNSDAENRQELTAREKEVVIGVVRGLSNKEIASDINVSVNTVMTHRRNIASKLQIHSPAGLTIYALVSKLVKLEDVSNQI